MAGVLGYTKKFIILKQDFSNMDEVKAKGHGKLEIKGLKGNISISLENAEANQFYNVIIVEGDQTYDLGKIYTEETGKGKEDLDFNLSDLESKGISLEKANGILVVRDEKVLLGEYIGKDNGSLERYSQSKQASAPPTVEIVESEPTIEEEAKEEVKEEPEEELVLEAESIIEEMPEEKLEEKPWIEVEFIEEEAEDEPETEEITYEEPEYIEEAEPEEIPTEDDFIAEYEPIADLSKESETITVKPMSYEGISDVDYTRKNQTTKYVLSILRYFPYIDPFSLDLHGYNWWRIEYQDDEKGFLPYFNYVTDSEKDSNIANSQITSIELMKKYEHYIFGLFNIGDEVIYYIYGVPGEFHKDEHPYNGATGFNTWFEGNEVEGYWLLYIDPLTGKVMEPINPMKPVD